MCKLCILLLLMVVSPPLVKSIEVSKMNKFAERAIELVISNNDLWQISNSYDQCGETSVDKKEKILYSKIDNINMRIEDLSEQEKVRDENITSLAEKLPQKPYLKRYFDELRNYQYLIDKNYNHMQKFVANREDYKNSTFLEFCEKVISIDTNSVKELIKRIQNITKTDLLQMIIEQQEINAETNSNKGQQFFYGILNQLLLTNFKRYITIQFAYFTKIIHKQGKFKKEIKNVTNSFKERINDLIINIRKYTAIASNELWKCDPEKHEIGKTYEQITNFLQGFIINTESLDPTGKCRDSCDIYNYVTHYTCGKNHWCYRQRPCPKILNCQRFDSEMTVCLSPSKNKNKRYEYIEHDHGRIFGKKGDCKREDYVSVSEYRNEMNWNCSFCFCLCDDGPKFFSDRFISLRPAVSDINNNRVVTGIRFVKHNRIIHLQIQEGQLLPEGLIDINTVQWVPVDDFKIIDANIYEGQDYHALSWEERGIELNTVFTDDKYLVTGVRFMKIGSRLELEVLTTPYNFTTGKLINPWDLSFYKNAPLVQLRHRFGKELVLISPDVPIRSKSSSIPYTGSADYIQFTNSDYDKDAAQTTVPFFDIQEVASSVPVPLVGVGIYYKGQSGYGGFIAPKIYTFDSSQHNLAPVFEIN